MQEAGERADVPGKALHLTANLFAVTFGLAGLAQAWSAVTQLAGASDWPANVLWIVAAVTYLITVTAYLANVAAQRRWKTELSDPTFGPFTSLIAIVPMLLGTRLAEQARGAGEVVFGCSAVLTVLAGAWITGDWIADDGNLRRWHPGYYLPTAAGGLIAGGASAALGFTTLSHVLFGLGATSFVLLGSIIQLRLFNAPALPAPLLPTIAIDIAPPVAAGNSWFAINGGRVDTVEAVLAGLAVWLILVQVRLIPLYRQAPFGPGFWAFLFPFAAAVSYGVHWLAAEHVSAGAALGYALVGVLTAGFALLAARTVTGLINGTFLPRVPAPEQGPRLTARPGRDRGSGASLTNRLAPRRRSALRLCRAVTGVQVEHHRGAAPGRGRVSRAPGRALSDAVPREPAHDQPSIRCRSGGTYLLTVGRRGVRGSTGDDRGRRARRRGGDRG